MSGVILLEVLVRTQARLADLAVALSYNDRAADPGDGHHRHDIAMDTSRRSFSLMLGALAASPLFDLAIAEAQAQGSVSADTVRALLDGQGGRSIFADPARFEELRSAVARTAAHLAVLRAFPVPDDVPPAIMFSRR